MAHRGRSSVAGSALAVLVGIAAAGALVWLATKPNEQTTAGYWATLGILAGAGLVFALGMALSRMARGRPLVSWPVLVGLVVAVVVVGWVAIAQQPHSNWFHDHVNAWSGDIGIANVVDDLGAHVAVLAFGLGLLLGWIWEPSRERAVRVGVPQAIAPYGGGANEQPTEVTQDDRTRAA
jgi:MFS superfamily sulfate permease-like transporter